MHSYADYLSALSSFSTGVQEALGSRISLLGVETVSVVCPVSQEPVGRVEIHLLVTVLDIAPSEQLTAVYKANLLGC